MNGGETPGGCRPHESIRCGGRSEYARLREVDQFDPEGERRDVENDSNDDGQHDPSGISAPLRSESYLIRRPDEVRAIGNSAFLLLVAGYVRVSSFAGSRRAHHR